MEDFVGKILGNYRLERVVGRGRMGVVYLAQDVVLLRRTAVKILSWAGQVQGQDPVKWFLAEARSVARINHPGVVQIYHVAKQENLRYIAMEYVEGNSIEAIITKEGPFHFSRASEVLCQVASALHAAHRCGIIHRDVKPANLLSSVNGRVKLGDFGMALSCSGSSVTSTTLRVGTPFFMAPELWQGSQATPASDIYSLGATYYYMLTGQQAFAAKNLDELREMHLNIAPPDPREVVTSIPSKCNEIIQRCMAKKPGDRFESAQELDWMVRGTLSVQEFVTGYNPDSHRNQVSQTLRNLIQSMLPRPAKGVLSEVMGFAYQPFSNVDLHHIPYTGEPFASLTLQLSQALVQPGGIVLVKGLRGSGKTVLCCKAANKLDSSQPVVYLDVRVERTQNLLQLIRRVVGGLPDDIPSASGELDGLMERLQALGSTHNLPVVVFIDNLNIDNELIHADLKALLRVVQFLKSVILVLIGSPTLDRELQKCGLLPEKGQVVTIATPSLGLLQTAAYINSWIKYSIDPTSPMLMITPDASLQVAHWSSGNMSWINRISLNMLHLAAFKNKRIVSSWEAWMASADQNRDKYIEAIEDVSPEMLAMHDKWPTNDALKTINECRRKALLPSRGETDVEKLLCDIGKARFL